MAQIFKYKVKTKNAKDFIEKTASVGGAQLDEAGFEAHMIHHKAHGEGAEYKDVEKVEETGTTKFDEVLKEVKERQAKVKAEKGKAPVVASAAPQTVTTPLKVG